MRDSNPRRLRRLIYSQIPLAAWVTRRGRAGRRPPYNTPRRRPALLGAVLFVLGFAVVFVAISVVFTQAMVWLQRDGQWAVTRAVMSRSARILMEGHVRVPADSF